MERLIYVVVCLCLFTPYVEGNVVCLRPTPPIDATLIPEKRAYFSQERVYITCSTEQHRLFGPSSWECKDGKWNVESSYCSKETNKFEVKNKDANYSVLLDKNGSSCLPISYFKSNSPVYIEMKGTHRLVIVELKDKPNEYTRHHKLYLFKDYSKRENYEDIFNYERCITGPGTYIHYCDFIKPITNPLILIEPGDEDSGCTTCRMCEIIFYEIREFAKEEPATKVPTEASSTTELPTEESTKEFSIADSSKGLTIILISVGVIAGVSLILSICVIIKFQRKRSKEKKSQANQNAVCQVEEDSRYDYVKDYHYGVQTHREDTHLHGRIPQYLNELVTVSNSRLKDESGYLVPIKNDRDFDDVNRQNLMQNADVHVYCRISDIPLRKSKIESSNL